QYRVPTAAYVCPDQAAKEWDAFFRNHPQLIGLSQDLPEPGSFFTLDDFGTPLLATRDRNGVFRAFLNACRHRAVKVASEPRGKQSIFMCPFHNWSYANTGDLIAIPNEDHFGAIDKSCHGLIALPAVERDGLLWVHPQADGHLDVDHLLGAELAAELASYGLARLGFAGATPIPGDLNWKFANDTFGETYHFGKLHKDTLGRVFYGNNLHFREFGRHHRFVTASRGIDRLRTLPEAEWRVEGATFVLYHLFPNIQLICSTESATLIRIYPDPANPGRSMTRVSFYFSPETAAEAAARDAAGVDPRAVYDLSNERRGPSLKSSFEVFKSTIEQEDYVMGALQQRTAETGQLKEVILGRNEPALHHFHSNYREALNQPPLEPVG
ncbi:aromatic ring-hydroxylating dioxygenase subunit alpha, partial [Phenylobacterium sp.]|uniref:aromatic ring-hydroxylating dioxygenase subunit alpha n=1 Tax=Phenylobacterium sp. TaxID=1871053 RepID=UPI0037C761C4